MSDKNIKVINVKDYNFSDGEGGGSEGSEGSRAGEELDDFLGDNGGGEQNYMSKKQDIIEFFSDSDEHSQGGFGESKGIEGSEGEGDSKADEEDDPFWGGTIKAIDEGDEEGEGDGSDGASEASYGGGKSEASTVDELSQDPMFLVLSHFLTSKNGENIADILQGIKLNLAKLTFKA